MSPREYQALTALTEAQFPDEAVRRTVTALGLVGEGTELLSDTLSVIVATGKVSERIKKEVGHGHPEDREALIAELGDVLWYVARLADSYGVSLEEVMAANIAKLAKRYPGGFSNERSIKREEGHGD